MIVAYFCLLSQAFPLPLLSVTLFPFGAFAVEEKRCFVDFISCGCFYSLCRALSKGGQRIHVLHLIQTKSGSAFGTLSPGGWTNEHCSCATGHPRWAPWCCAWGTARGGAMLCPWAVGWCLTGTPTRVRQLRGSSFCCYLHCCYLQMEEGWRFREVVVSHITESSSSIVVIFPRPDPLLCRLTRFALSSRYLKQEALTAETLNLLLALLYIFTFSGLFYAVSQPEEWVTFLVLRMKK